MSGYKIEYIFKYESEDTLITEKPLPVGKEGGSLPEK
jgi:hypothetical protein